ncbi:hypothetical protein AB0O76_05890 [Streptomyces sp. NPDC086554]|uniref:hypothetical protein n=1 Tax=Streptomyces sp. NPDC086554 TaxID=3154864 RepID=UPI00341E25B1
MGRRFMGWLLAAAFVLPSVSACDARPEEPKQASGASAEDVRDAWSRVQGTLQSGCNAKDCGDYLESVAGEIGRLEDAMRGSPDPGHFDSPVRRIDAMQEKVRERDDINRSRETIITTRQYLVDWFSRNPETSP